MLDHEEEGEHSLIREGRRVEKGGKRRRRRRRRRRRKGCSQGASHVWKEGSGVYTRGRGRAIAVSEKKGKISFGLPLEREGKKKNQHRMLLCCFLWKREGGGKKDLESAR